MKESKRIPGVIKLPDSDIDKAYDLLVVIIGLIFSMMGSNPELFWAPTPEMSLEVQAIRSTILPLIILALLWLGSKLIPNENSQILLRFVAWMTAFSLVVQLIFVYLHGAKFISIDNLGPLGELIFIGLLFTSPLVAYILIFPKYKEKFPDATFFKSRIWSIVSYLLCLLVIGSIVILPSTLYVA